MRVCVFIRVFTALHCNTKQYSVDIRSWKKHLLHDNIVQHTATRCNTVPYSATQCNTVQHSATHCNTLQHTATNYKHSVWEAPHALQHTARYCNTMQHNITHCNTLQHTIREAPSKFVCPFHAKTRVTLQHTATHCNTLHALRNSVVPSGKPPTHSCAPFTSTKFVGAPVIYIHIHVFIYTNIY